jgi:hypothetical protein
MQRPGFTAFALAMLIGLSCYQIVSLGELRNRLDRLETKPSPLKQAVVADTPRAGRSGPAAATDRPPPRQAAANAAAALPPWLVARKWEEMLHDVEVWSGDGKLSSRIIELGELSQSQAQQLEALKKSFLKARQEVPVLPPQVIENAGNRVIVQMNREDTAAIKQLQTEQAQTLDSILGDGFDPALRSRILPSMRDAELTEITIERVDNENFSIGRNRKEAGGDAIFSATKFTASESRLPEILSDKEKAALRLAGREY